MGEDRSKPIITESRIVHYMCPSCGCSTANELIGEHPSGHYSRIECCECQRFLRWGKKPENEGQVRRKSSSRKLVNAHSRGFCEICLRPSAQIPVPQTLEAHHIIPVEHGGTDEKGNIQIVCTACHRLIHHQRTYLGHYNKSLETAVLVN